MIFDNGACFILFFINMPINPIISICFFVTLHFFTVVFVIIINLPHVYGFNSRSLKALLGSLVPLLFHREIRCCLRQRPCSNSRRSEKTGFFSNNCRWCSIGRIANSLSLSLTSSVSVSVSVSLSVSVSVSLSVSVSVSLSLSLSVSLSLSLSSSVSVSVSISVSVSESVSETVFVLTHQHYHYHHNHSHRL